MDPYSLHQLLSNLENTKQNINEITVFGMPQWACWLIIGILLIVSGIFSASENAFSNCNKYHFKVLADQGKITPKIIVSLTEKFESTLVSVLVGNNISQTVMSTISALLFYNICKVNGWGSSIEALLSTFVMAFLVYIVSDTIPKILSNAIPNRLVYVLAWPDYIVFILLFPIVYIFKMILKLVHKIFKVSDENILSKEDILIQADEAINDENLANPNEELFEEEELQMLNKAFSFDTIDVKKITKPLKDVICININYLTVKQVNKIITNNDYSRYPVFNKRKNDIVGILSLNTYLSELMDDEHLDIRSILQEPVLIPETSKIDDAFDILNKEKVHMGLVTDSDNKVIGMITMDAIINELIDSNPIDKNGNKQPRTFTSLQEVIDANTEQIEDNNTNLISTDKQISEESNSSSDKENGKEDAE